MTHCGACGRALVLDRIWYHVLEPWDRDYRPHDAEPVVGTMEA